MSTDPRPTRDGAARIEDGYEVVVVGCGMAGLAAGTRAAERDRSVVVLEKSPRAHRGGHTRFTESFRVPSADCDLTPWGYEFDIPDYTREDFYEDLMKQTSGRADPDLARTLANEAGETIEWLTDLGVEWDMEPLAAGYTAARTWHDGEALVDSLCAAAEAAGATIVYDAEARRLYHPGDFRVAGLEAHVGDEVVRFDCDAAVLAAGGYESSEEKRTKYMGPEYDAMTVRGSRYNTGEAIDMAVSFGAKPVGQWSGAHMALIDAASPPVEGGTNRVDGYQFGVIVNHEGTRFVDEGADAREHTYARFGREIFEQPGHEAFIVIDAGVRDQMRPTGPGGFVEADDLRTLMDRLGVKEAEAAVETVETFNAACDPGEFDPDRLDGNRTEGISPPKSNWALPIEEPPFYGHAVTGGITFAFGGVETTTRTEVVDTRDRVVPGLFAAGNSTGGLFYDNYPGGTGLTNAAVFGRLAGEAAAEYVADGGDRAGADRV